MIDKIEIIVKGGDGGNGAVSFRREKFVSNGGPDGGDGGKGGDVYLEASEDVTGFEHLRYKKQYLGNSGEKGARSGREGKKGQDLFIKVPVGTMGKFEGATFDLREKGEKLLVAKGGAGGIGNTRYWRIKLKETRARPHGFWDRRERMLEAKPGGLGEEIEVEMELKLIADVGLVGLPNGGKSSLLSVLTNAKPKIADYPFTTLEPNLGIYKNIILADIPGLIEGASGGKGLGTAFLKHISRTKVVLHVMALEESDKDPKYAFDRLMYSYDIVRKELKSFGEGLLEKKEILIINKMDLVDKAFSKTLFGIFSKHKKKVLGVSAVTGEGLDDLKIAIMDAIKGL